MTPAGGPGPAPDEHDAVAPPRGFPRSEFEARLERMQAFMRRDGLDALLLTTPQQVRYVTGFDSQFWESPTRPWYVVVPASGPPVAVVPDIGAPGMRRTWVDDVRSWAAPNPPDDGVTLLAEALADVAGAQANVGAELGRELHLRMPIVEFERLREISGVRFLDGSGVVRSCRHVKSELEIDKIRYACEITSAAYASLPARYREGDTERSFARRLRSDVAARGADSSPYLVCVSGPGGYDNVVMGPGDRTLRAGDVVSIDTGTLFDGYFCDFNRNWAIGTPDDAVKRAYEAVWETTELGIGRARPGVRVRDLWQAMAEHLRAAGSLGNNVGRLGHGLGLQLTEPPSTHPLDETVLEVGTVLTVEPGMEFAPGRLMVHEEDLVIRDGPPEVLTRRAAPQLPVIS